MSAFCGGSIFSRGKQKYTPQKKAPRICFVKERTDDPVKLYPLKLEAVLKDTLWGGTLLSERFGKGEAGRRIAESWAPALRKDGENRIENGEGAGMLLGEYAALVGMEALCGWECAGKAPLDFPLLVKLIDARDRLSVQVHPDDAYAHSHGIDSGKTEMWYIVEARPGAKLVYGLKRGEPFDPEALRAAALDGTLEKHLHFADVQKGDVYYIPAGLVHAIGAGILIAEVQQNSNTTYRLYDYDRRGADGKKRELHIDEALRVIRTDFSDDPAFGNTRPTVTPGEVSSLVDSAFFDVSLVFFDAAGSATLPKGRMHSLLCIDGEGVVTADGETVPMQKGDSVLVPAGCGETRVATADTCRWLIAHAKD